MPKRTYDAKIVWTGDDCIINFNNETYVYKDLKDTFGDQTKVTIEVKTRRKPRSLSQNNFYWGYFLQYQIDCFEEFWGEKYDKKTVHEWNKQQFFGEEKVIERTGEVIRVPGSSREPSTIEFEEKLDDIRQWFFTNFDFVIPYPEQQETLNFK